MEKGPKIPNPEAKEFSKEVLVDGENLVFKGETNEELRVLELYLEMPDWRDEVEGLDVGPERLPDILISKGCLGYVVGAPDERENTIHLQNMSTFTRFLRDDSKYRKVHAGRFLMKSFLEFADKNSWDISARPEATGEMTDDDITNWLKRNDFEEVDGERDLIRKAKK